MTPTLSYAQYERALAVMLLPPERQVAFSLPGPLSKFVTQMKNDLVSVSENVGVAFKDLVKAIANRDAFAFLKAIKFSFKSLMAGLHTLAKLVPNGLNAFFLELQSSDVVKRIKAGALSVDAFLDKHPIIKKLAGPALAALLFWMWTQAAFIGNPWTDLDLSLVGAALTGNYTIADLFTSPDGLAGLALFAAGILTPGIGISWLGYTASNALLALLFTVARKSAPQVCSVLKQHLPKFNPLSNSR